MSRMVLKVPISRSCDMFGLWCMTYVKVRWSDPIILCLVFFVINDQINSETGVRPLDAMLSSADWLYPRLPKEAAMLAIGIGVRV